jgi:hypothetical protein
MAKRKYAVLVGCNYPNAKFELHGCVNDVLRTQSTLIHRFGFAKENIDLLIDTDEAYTKPTGENIRAALRAMIRRANAGDVLFFHYSGHGTLSPKNNSIGNDECIVPCDFKLITDEDFRLIVNEVPLGTTFTMVSDSCHSGGLIDKEKEQIGPVDATYRSLTNPERPRQRSSKSKFIPLDSLLEILREKTGEAETESDKIKIALFHLFGEKATSRIHRLVNTGCSVLEEMEVHIKGRRLEYDHEELQQGKQSIHPDMGILLSGCQTDETSADACPTGDRNKAYGAFSNAIQTILEQHGKAPIGNRELVLGARKLLVEQGYSQHPCLYCSDMNADAPFLY